MQDIVKNGQVERHRRLVLTASHCNKTKKMGSQSRTSRQRRRIRSSHIVKGFAYGLGLAFGGREGLDAVVLDEDEERVLHLPSREPDAAHDLRQRQRAVAEEALAHLLREGIRKQQQELGHQQYAGKKDGRGGGGPGNLRIRGGRSGRR
jgi:hypothetical protein